MLSAETAIGAHPELVIETIDRIVRRAEKDFDYARWGDSLGVQEASGERGSPLRVTAAITGAGWRAAIEEDAAAIVAISASGMTVRAISRFRPSMPIVAVTETEFRASQLRMSWGVASVLVNPSRDPKELIDAAVAHMLETGLVVPGDVVLLLSGSHETPAPMTDQVRLLKVGG
jgi:pyruvate kinase